MVKELTVRQLEIIDAAGKILTNSGVNGLTIKNLAKEMKFSESAIYRHFKSKEQIIVSMLEYLAETMDLRYTNIIDPELSPKEKFVNLFNEQFSFFDENPHYVTSIFSEGLMETSEQINNTILSLMAVKIKHLLPIIAEGQETGAFTKDISAEHLLHIVMGSFRLQMFKWRMSHFGFNLKEEGEEIIKSLLVIISQ